MYNRLNKISKANLLKAQLKYTKVYLKKYPRKSTKLGVKKGCNKNSLEDGFKETELKIRARLFTILENYEHSFLFICITSKKGLHPNNIKI
jgi:hypothetical protein